VLLARQDRPVCGQGGRAARHPNGGGASHDILDDMLYDMFHRICDGCWVCGGPGKIGLCVGKEVVQRGIPMEEVRHMTFYMTCYM
jgi:hypothetical protein